MQGISHDAHLGEYVAEQPSMIPSHAQTVPRLWDAAEIFDETTISVSGQQGLCLRVEGSYLS